MVTLVHLREHVTLAKIAAGFGIGDSTARACTTAWRLIRTSVKKPAQKRTPCPLDKTAGQRALSTGSRIATHST